MTGINDKQIFDPLRHKQMQVANVRLHPVDFVILEQIKDGKRYTAPYLAEDLDWAPNYIGDRLREMESSGLVNRVGESAMFTKSELTDRALELRPHYSHDHAQEWTQLLYRTLDVPINELNRIMPDDVNLDNFDIEDLDSS